MYENARSVLCRSMLAALLLVLAMPLSAAIFTPNSFDDRIDASPGDGVCATAPPVVCTLRAAVMEANALAGPDTIVLPAGTYRLTRAGSGENGSLTGDLDITDVAGLIIQAAESSQRPVIDANLLDRALDVRAGPFVLNGIRITNGRAMEPELFGDSSTGGGILLRNGADNLIHLSEIDGNRASLFGGGIFRGNQPGTLRIMLSRVANNRAGLDDDEGSSGGGLYLYDGDDAEVQMSRFEANRAGYGAAILLRKNNLLLRYSVLSGNIADKPGQGRDNGIALHAVEESVLRVENSSVYWNDAPDIPIPSSPLAAIAVAGGTLLMFSSTVADNGYGGILSAGSDATLQNVTLAGNQYGLTWFNNSLMTGVAKTLFIRNSIMAHHVFGSCHLTLFPGDVHDINGHNLNDDGGCNLAPAGFGNLVNVYPQLHYLDTSLALPARMPAQGSPVIDAGSPLDPASGNPEACFQFDQLGVARAPGRCDIGAVERQGLFADGFEP